MNNLDEMSGQRYWHKEKSHREILQRKWCCSVIHFPFVGRGHEKTLRKEAGGKGRRMSSRPTGCSSIFLSNLLSSWDSSHFISIMIETLGNTHRCCFVLLGLGEISDNFWPCSLSLRCTLINIATSVFCYVFWKGRLLVEEEFQSRPKSQREIMYSYILH